MTDPISQAEAIVRDSEARQRRRRRRNGLIVGLTLALSMGTGPLWAQPSDSAEACTKITAGRAGTLPCERHNSKADDAIEKLIGSTAVGCIVGGLFGGVGGIVAGCTGAAVGNIGW